jgi:GT2 family glycosyltransferase
MLNYKNIKETNSVLVSIVLLNCNGAEYLKKTIKALLDLEYDNCEIIVVDNGSVDESLAFLRSFTQIKIIENRENLGYSKGKNIGVKYAHGEYILLLDNDILVVNNDILPKLLNLYKSDPEIGFIQVPLLDLGQETTKHYGLFYSIYGVNSHQKLVNKKSILNLQAENVLIGSPTGGCIFFKKNLWDMLGGLDESQGFNIDDVDIGPRASLFGYKSVLFTKDYFIHLGINNVNVKNVYSKRFKFVFSGHARSMIKNYKIKNLLLRLPLLYFFHLLKSVRYAIKRKDLDILFSFFYSNVFFIKNLPETIERRIALQANRTVKDDIFLKIKPPNINLK